MTATVCRHLIFFFLCMFSLVISLFIVYKCSFYKPCPIRWKKSCFLPIYWACCTKMHFTVMIILSIVSLSFFLLGHLSMRKGVFLLLNVHLHHSLHPIAVNKTSDRSWVLHGCQLWALRLTYVNCTVYSCKTKFCWL